MSAQERLEQIKARAESATHYGRHAKRVGHDDDLAEFTASQDAMEALVRTDVPALVATLEAVLELHKPVDVEPCDTICGECSYRLPNGRYMPTVEHPCPTVTAINEALGGTS